MNLVSYCCHKPIIAGSFLEQPLNDGYYIRYKIDICEGCGMPAHETIEECEVCGVVGCAEDCE